MVPGTHGTILVLFREAMPLRAKIDITNSTNKKSLHTLTGSITDGQSRKSRFHPDGTHVNLVDQPRGVVQEAVPRGAPTRLAGLHSKRQGQGLIPFLPYRRPGAS